MMANEFGSDIPVFSAEPQPQDAGFGANIPVFEVPQSGAGEARPRVSRTEDIVRSGISGLAEGVPELIGLPGTIGAFASSATRSAATPVEQDGKYFVPSMAPGASGAMREISPEHADRMRSGEKSMVEKALSYVNPFSYAPTGAQVKEFAASTIPGYQGVMEYNPDTIYGTLVKGAMKELPTAAIPFGGPLLGRVGGALGSGSAAEAVRSSEYGKGAYSVPLQMGAALLGGVGGTLGTQFGGQFLAAPFRRGEPTASNILEELFKRDLAEATPADRAARMAVLKEAGKTGVSPEDIAPISLIGDRGRKIVSALGASSDDILNLNQTIARAQQSAPDNVARDVAALVRRPSPVSFSQEQALLAEFKNSVNNPAYTAVMSSPRAQNIPNAVYSDVTQYELFRRELPSIMAKVEPLKGRLGIVTPDFQAGTPGNLAFWDFAKKHFDVMGDTERAMRDSYREIAKQIRGASDRVVPQYASVRDRAAEMIGYDNAMKLGYDMIDMSNKRFSSLRPQEASLLQSMTPHERGNMRVGMVAGLTDAMLSPRGPSDVQRLFKIMQSPEMGRRLGYAFSPQEIMDIYGSAARNAIVAKAAPVSGGAASSDIVSAAGIKHALRSRFGNPAAGAAAGAVGGVLANVVMQQSLMNFDWAHAAALVAGAIYGSSVNAAQKRTTEQLLRMLNDPAQTVELGRLLAQSPQAASLYSRINDMMSQNLAANVALRSQTAVDEPRPLTIPLQRPQRASGGRINPEMMADRIIGQIEKARKELQSQTGELLNHDDETIVKALKIANERI